MKIDGAGYRKLQGIEFRIIKGPFPTEVNQRIIELKKDAIQVLPSKRAGEG